MRTVSFSYTVKRVTLSIVYCQKHWDIHKERPERNNGFIVGPDRGPFTSLRDGQKAGPLIFLPEDFYLTQIKERVTSLFGLRPAPRVPRGIFF